MGKNTQPDWKEIREQFELDRSYVQLGTSQFIASHPKPVREAIDRYRNELDKNPVKYLQENNDRIMSEIREEAAKFLGNSDADQIALTDSTTMALGTVYTGLNLESGEEILLSDHEHYSHFEAVRRATERSGASYRRIRLYENLSEVSADEIVHSIVKEISDKTRILGLTWVHSGSGLKTPVQKISREISRINSGRDKKDEVKIVLDAVHGFGIETESPDELGCTFFITGCHKWLYGPRGTGIVSAAPEDWDMVSPIIPSFTDAMDLIIQDEDHPRHMSGKQMTPGGFHSFEHRWALLEAFRFMSDRGKDHVRDRVHELSRRCKEGLAEMSHVTLHTPMDDELSAGIISFEVKGYSAKDAAKALMEKKVIATAAPYRVSYVRFTPGIINSEEEIDKALEAVKEMR
jgi:selenocysteine lyase/cysteine desulfurase